MTAVVPLSVALALAALLFFQSRKSEAVQRAFLASEQRFRLAVEAAHAARTLPRPAKPSSRARVTSGGG